MNYAVVRFGGKQYLVRKGDRLLVDKVSSKGPNIVLEEVLLAVSDGSLKIGKPTVSGIGVKAKILETKKGQKVDVYKFKAKSRYRRSKGFRPMQSLLEILDIEGVSTEKIAKSIKSKSK
jgi:large subunit ribosomal protein L21